MSDAAEAAREGLSCIVPFVENHAEAFSDLARSLGSNHMRYSEEAGVPPDEALLEKVAEALGVPEGMQALIQAIAAKADATGELDEDLLGQLPAEIADQLRSAFEESRNDGA